MSDLAPFLTKYWKETTITIAIGTSALIAYKKWTANKRLKEATDEEEDDMDGREKPERMQSENFESVDNDFYDDLANCPEKQLEYQPRKQNDNDYYFNSRYTEDEMFTRAKEFFNLMNLRRSCRFMSDAPVPREVIEEIIRTASTGPSGAHTQPWTYVVVQNPEYKKEIRRIIEEEEEVNYRKRMGMKWINDLKNLRTSWSWKKPYLEDAPYLIVVFKQAYALSNGHRKTLYYNEISTCISVGILLAAIQNVGLCTLTSTPMNAGPRLRSLLNRPPNEKVILLLPVGYAATDATVPDLKRKELKDVLIWED
ncbi:DgyrCDS2547 [Dimorphilus gyrociliatus]|uniref:DgyrCDS2547 n=1 Tax=Dimorphilus gyrociliatus TaxID=2664684 RepID=A0A7I8VDP6_9ANNE|nr:DgyrCDS2547 [Dimorphilus gyrociliatus]